MRIGNSGIDMMAVMLKMQNARNVRHNTAGTNANNRQSQIQPAPSMAIPEGWSPIDPLSFRNVGVNNSPQALNLTEGDLIFMDLRLCSVRYANAFLHGPWTDSRGITRGEAPGIGTSVFLQRLGEAGIELPDDARFSISVNRYGRVTITGLDDAELAARIEEALSYDSRQINQLGVFVRSARILEGVHITDANPFSSEQSRLLQIQSDLMDFGVGLHDLRLENGRIVGLPQELHDRIYGDRSEWLSGMEPMEAQWEVWNINRIRDDAIHFLQNGTAHVPAPYLPLTFTNGRMVVNIGGFNATT